MEVTSHALVQKRVHGLAFDIGIFTNLTMLEHLEYHGSFRDYALAKLRFLDHLAPDAPLIFAAGDRTVRQAARRHTGPRISCGGGRAAVVVRRDELTLAGTRATLAVRHPLPRSDGTCIEPVSIPLELRALGRPNIMNATLAATAALILGAPADTVRTALAAVEPPRRRLEVVAREPTVIDDTVGHPDSITAVFELAARIPHRELRAVFCVRGHRGPAINRRTAEALAIWARRVRVHALHVTSATEAVDERNAVTAAERQAFVDVLARAGLHYVHHDRLDAAVQAALADVAPDDVVLLLGAQGMDGGAALARAALGRP
jgi:UDP-N-acetylmuramoyl-L-alanyl-D-glutamate--2,6-diaminopimelate ligase